MQLFMNRAALLLSPSVASHSYTFGNSIQQARPHLLPKNLSAVALRLPFITAEKRLVWMPEENENKTTVHSGPSKRIYRDFVSQHEKELSYL